jgi:pimeloyl-[acyl-carrier protein] methyl ester esterase
VLELARRYPERVQGVILLAGNPHFTEVEDWPGAKPHLLQHFADNLTADCRATLTRFLALQVNGLADGKSLLKTLKTAVAECDPPDSETLQGGLEILKQADLRPVLANLSIPVLAVSGSHDTLVPSAVVPRIGALSAHIETHVMAGAGHLPFLSHGRELRALIADFMDKY